MTDQEIGRIARELVAKYGELALPRAVRRTAEVIAAGDDQGWRDWLNVQDAVTEVMRRPFR